MPGIFCWPGTIRSGQVTDETVMTMDLLPTFARLAGATLPARQPTDGVDLSGLLLRGEPLPKRDLCWRIGTRCAVRRGPWKLNLSDRRRPELYNLTDDLGETTNLAEAHPELVASLAAGYDAWLADVDRGYVTTAVPTGVEATKPIDRAAVEPGRVAPKEPVGSAWAKPAGGTSPERAGASQPEGTRPNIVFILADDLGPWAMGCAGNPNARTPQLDRLRAGGAMLTHCYSPTPVCSPARASILTSRYGSELGITDFLPPGSGPTLDPAVPTWPRLLQQAGYDTALVGKYHCGEKPQSHPTRIGYGLFTGFIHGGMVSKDPVVEIDGVSRVVEGYTPDILTDHALAFIRQQRTGPFALSLHFWAPHANKGTNAQGGRTWLPLQPADWDHFQQANPLLPEPDYPDLDVVQARRMSREYLASVHSLDRNVGRVLDLLDELDLADNTLVIFSSDHGYNLAHRGIWHKGNGRWLLVHNHGSRPNMWDNSLRVPALVRWPRAIEPGSTVTETISHLDWFPTILAAAGVKAPPQMLLRGRNVLPSLRGRPQQLPEEFFAQYDMRGGDDMRSYQTGRWKLIRFLRGTLPDEFYDRRADPAEQHSLAASTDPQVRAAMAELDAKLRAAMKKIDDPGLDRLPKRP